MTTDKSVSRTNGQQNSSSIASGPVPRSCDLCGYITSQPVCKACLLLEGLNKGRPRQGVERTKKKTNQDPIIPPTTATAASTATVAATTSARCCGAGGCSGKCQGGGQCGGGGSGGGGGCGGASCSGTTQAENTRMASQVMAGVMAGVGSRVAVAAYGVAPGVNMPAGGGQHPVGSGGGRSVGSCGGSGGGGGRAGGSGVGCVLFDASEAKDAGAGDVGSGSSPGADAVEDESSNAGQGRNVRSNSIDMCLTKVPVVCSLPSGAVAGMDESASRPGSVPTAAQGLPAGSAGLKRTADTAGSAQAALDVGVPVRSSRGLPLEIQYEE